MMKNLSIKNTLKLSAGMMFSVLLFSCECSRTAHGVIVDELTLEPLDSVLVKGVQEIVGETYSDEDGNYIIGAGMMGAVGGCPDVKVAYAKEGYHAQTLQNPSYDTIYMRPE